MGEQHARLLLGLGPGVPLGSQIRLEARDRGRRVAVHAARLLGLGPPGLRVAQRLPETDVDRPRGLAVAARGPVHGLDKL